jgi:predicted transposase YbfD/YdcC
MNDRISNLRRIPFTVLAIFAFVSQSLFVVTPASAQRSEDRGGDLRTVSSLPTKGKRWALVVGVDNYGLQGAVNDARALRNVLIRYAGFPEDQVITLTTGDPDNPPTRNNILSELDKLARSVPADGLFLFSFSGHGKTVENDAYLIPSDGRMSNSKRAMIDFSIDVTRIGEALAEMKFKQVIILIDACRTKIVGRGSEAEALTPAMSRRFSFDETNRDIEAFITLYSTRLSESAYEYFDRETNQYRGYFSKAVEEALSGKAANERGEITLAALVKYLEEAVPARSYRTEGVRQVPWKNSSGYRESGLVLAIAPRMPAASGAAVPAAWAGFSGVAKKLIKYDAVADFYEGLAGACLNERCGFIDRSGTEVIPLRYERISHFSEGLVCVKLGGKWGYADKTGSVVIAPKYDQVINFMNGFAPVRLNDKWGMIDKTGKLVVPIRYEDVNSYSEGLIAVQSNGKFGFIDISGRVVIPFRFDGAQNFSEGLAAASLDEKWGFIDKRGDFVIRPEYDAASRFVGGLGMVANILVGIPPDAEYNWGLIDKSGRMVRLAPSDPESPGEPLVVGGREFHYNIIEEFSEGLAVAIWHGRQGFIDRSGREVIPPRYDGCKCGPFSDGLAQVALNDKFGFVDRSGREVIPVKYDDVWCGAFAKEGFIGVLLDGKKGFADVHGNEYFGL